MQNAPGATPRAVVTLEALERLIPSLERRGYQVAGPILRDGAIVYDTLKKLSDLPVGWTDEQEAGRYRLKKRGSRKWESMRESSLAIRWR